MAFLGAGYCVVTRVGRAQEDSNFLSNAGPVVGAALGNGYCHREIPGNADS